MFQSSPGAKTGCNVLWAQLQEKVFGFQSSPGAKTGCNALRTDSRGLSSRFNPHPVQRPGATIFEPSFLRSSLVSILTRCKDRVQHMFEPSFLRSSLVSILTRCKDRVQRDYLLDAYPVRKLVSILTRCKDRVQQGNDVHVTYGDSVSILTRCKDRVQPGGLIFGVKCCGFNPHPVQRPGATGLPFHQLLRNPCFNPHPVQRPGATGTLYIRTFGTGFNPHPVQRPGATLPDDAEALKAKEFQSSPGAKTGCNDAGVFVRRRICGVSILTRCKDRVQPQDAHRARSGGNSFNPHPVQRPGATCMSHPAEAISTCFNPHPVQRPGATPRMLMERGKPWFQSSPGAKTGCNCAGLPFSRRIGRFNPHPVQRPGATHPQRHNCAHATKVSILTRCKDRVQQDAHRARSGGNSFNPHPVQRPGATERIRH